MRCLLKDGSTVGFDIWVPTTAVGYSQSSVSQPVPCVCFSARADDSSERASDSSERAGDSSESAGDNGKDYRGFLREHVRLYPKFVRQWGVSGCQRSQRWVLLVINSKWMGW